ncbi:MAG: hypothetical protein EHM65_02695 [Acidobacteriales bacterium]|nr:MAG: hypothetical protein EHM65_02695 [Terriglobales bacterium]
MPDATPTALEELGDRRFSFYPAIANTEHNEWLLRRATWSEILVANTKTGLEVWVPRRFVGEISSVGEPVMIIGLRKELELKAGSVWPRERRLLSMPRAGSGFLGSDATAENQPHAAGSRPSPGPEGKVGRLILGALALGVGLLVLLVAVTQRPVTYKGVEQLALQLSGEDDYSSIVRKLGSPMDDHWRAAAGELQYRALRYRGRDYTLILMGADQKSAHYIGAMDSGWKPVHSVRLPDGGSTLAMLRRLPKF